MSTAVLTTLGSHAEARSTTTRWRVLLGIVLVLHGLAHANAVTWAIDAAPLWFLSVVWGVAMLGYLAAGFGLLRVPLISTHWKRLMTAAMGASIVLLTLAGGTMAFAGVVIDVALLALLARWAQLTEGRVALLGDVTPWSAVRSHRVAKSLALLFLAYAAAVALVRPLYLQWGTTPAERAMVLPGDELVFDPRYRVDHGVTIHAPVGKVWPWLVQLGQDRGGFYSYDWLERLIGDDVHNADRIHPEWQRLEPGDLVRAAQPDYLWGIAGNNAGWRVNDVIPGRAIVLENWGAFVLLPVNDSTTRFLVRTRGDGEPSMAAVVLGPLGIFVFEPAHFIMQRAMMHGIRDRAERTE